MGIKDIGVNRLPLLAKANGLADSDDVVADVQANIRQEFGDGFSRINAAELKHLREKYYARERLPGSVRLLDLLIRTLDPQAGSEHPEAEQASAGPSAQSSREASKPADAPDGKQAVTTKATSLLKSLGGSPTSAASTPARQLSRDDYAKRARLVKAGDASLKEGFRVEAALFSDDGAVLRCLNGFDLHKIQASDPERATTVKLEPVGDALEGALKNLSAGSKYVFAADYKDESNPEQGQLYVWNAETGKLLTNSHARSAGSSAFAPVLREEGAKCHWLSEDAGQFITLGESGMVREHWLRTGKMTESQLPANQSFDISKDGKLIFGISHWDEESDDSPNGAHLYVRGEDGFKEVPIEDSDVDPEESYFMGFSEGGAYAVVWVQDEGIRVWDTQAGKLRSVGAGDYWASPGCAAVSANGKILAVTLEENAVQLYDIDTHKPIGKPIPLDLPPGAEPAALSFSPDGSRLFVRAYGEEHRVIAFG